MIDLPADAVDWPVALDTEASGLFVDDGARVAVVSCAWRQHDEIQSRVYAFDQGLDTWLGRKTNTPRRYPGPSLFDVEATNLGVDEWRALGDWLKRQALIYHNSKYDQHILRTGLRGLESETAMPLGRAYHWDTMVVAPLLWPNEPNGLKPIATRLWGSQETAAEIEMKTWLRLYCGKKDPRYDLAPWQIMEPYARHDPVLTLRLYELQRELLYVEKVLDPKLAEREVDFAQVLYRMEVRGIGYDVEAAAQAHATLLTRINAAKIDLGRETGLSLFTEASMRHYWFGTGRRAPIKETPDGAASVSKDVVRQLVEEGVRGAREYQTLTQLETAEAMWYGNWYHLVGRDGRLRTSYWQTKSQDERQNRNRGTVSGRVAVERVQVQAIPHDYQLPPDLPTVRSFIVPKPGFILVELDMNQAEMRTAAGMTKCVAMLEGFERGDDAHSITCRTTFKIDESSPSWKRLRNISKRLNFGLIYGAGEGVIREQIVLFVGIDPDPAEVHEWMVDFKAAMPELDKGARLAHWQADQYGYVTMAGGRRRYFRFGEPTHKAFNAKIQGSVSQCMAMAQIEAEAQMPGYQLLQIHDSLLLEVPYDDEGRDIVRAYKAIMQKAFESQIDAPFLVDGKVWH